MNSAMKHGGMDIRAPKEAEAPKELRHLEVRKAENGGHTVQHVYESYEHKEAPHVFAENKQSIGIPKGHMLEHVAKTMGVPHHTLGEQPRSAKNAAVTPKTEPASSTDADGDNDGDE